MVSVLPSSVVDRVLEPRSGKTKDYKIGMCCFSAKQAVVLRRRIICPCGSTCTSNIYNTGISSIVNIKILVIPVL